MNMPLRILFALAVYVLVGLALQQADGSYRATCWQEVRQ